MSLLQREQELLGPTPALEGTKRIRAGLSSNVIPAGIKGGGQRPPLRKKGPPDCSDGPRKKKFLKLIRHAARERTTWKELVV